MLHLGRDCTVLYGSSSSPPMGARLARTRSGWKSRSSRSPSPQLLLLVLPSARLRQNETHPASSGAHPSASAITMRPVGVRTRAGARGARYAATLPTGAATTTLGRREPCQLGGASRNQRNPRAAGILGFRDHGRRNEPTTECRSRDLRHLVPPSQCRHVRKMRCRTAVDRGEGPGIWVRMPPSAKLPGTYGARWVGDPVCSARWSRRRSWWLRRGDRARQALACTRSA